MSGIRRAILTIIVSVCAFLSLAGTGAGSADSDEPLFPDLIAGMAPGDYGYMHDQYHASYQKLFGIKNRCACGDGECRATVWRPTKLGSPVGYDVAIARHWYPLDATTWMPDQAESVPSELFKEWAHICAYPMKVDGEDSFKISCAMINKKPT